MNLLTVLIQTLGGLGLFIFGMNMMTEGLQMSAGDRIKKILSAVSSNRFLGFLTGTGVTAVIQSSSATTVILIGFVGAGMMTLNQAVGVILGANVGTTITSQMIAFKLSSLAFPAIAIGVILKYFSKKRLYRYLGEVILGFGILFLGMTIMKQGLAPFKHDAAFISFFTRFDASSLSGILFCVATGAGLTFIVQSSSATICLTMTLATQGLLNFPAAMALVLGENIGTTITAQLATIGSKNVNTYRVARAHALFNIIGVIIMVIIFPVFLDMVKIFTDFFGAGALTEVVDDDVINISRYIANGHSIFNIVNAFIFLFFMPLLIKVSIWISPKEEVTEDAFRLPNFDDRFIDSPIAALARTRSEVIRMSHSAIIMFETTTSALETRNLKKLHKWIRYEQHLDDMQSLIISYLTRVYQSKVIESYAKEISSLMRMTNNIERIGDSVEDIAIMIEKIIDGRIEFSNKAKADVKKLSEKVIEFLHYVTESISETPDQFMKHSQIMEDDIDFMREQMRDAHIERLRLEQCGDKPGLIFGDILSKFEKIGDYCYNIAQAVVGIK